MFITTVDEVTGAYQILGAFWGFSGEHIHLGNAIAEAVANLEQTAVREYEQTYAIVGLQLVFAVSDRVFNKVIAYGTAITEPA
jgi:hypothetical protein